MNWVGRNKWGLVLFVPALLLALAASSFRLVNLYLPWSSERSVSAVHSVEIPSDRTVVEYPGDEDYLATLTPLSLLPVDVGGDYVEYRAAPGARLWKLVVEVSADPQMVLDECRLALEDETGTVYGASGGKISDGGVYVDTWGDLCINSDFPGPTTDLNNVYVPAESGYERPRNYTIERFFALPTGTQPTSVRVSVARAPHWVVPAPIP